MPPASSLAENDQVVTTSSVVLSSTSDGGGVDENTPTLPAAPVTLPDTAVSVTSTETTTPDGLTDAATPSPMHPTPHPTNSMDTDGSLYPIAILIDELKNEEATTRHNAMKRLPTIAAALGPVRSREELLPFLSDNMDDDDDVLMVLATQLQVLLPLLGGDAYATCVLGLLEQLMTFDEASVRSAAVTTFLAVLAVLPPEKVSSHAVTLFARLASNDWFTSRISACMIVAAIYNQVAGEDDAATATLRRSFAPLCQEETTPMVKRAAAAALGPLVTAMATRDPPRVVSELLPLILGLARDKQDCIRLHTIDTVAALAAVVPSNLVTDTLVPTLVAAATDKSWRVRWSVANKFSVFCEAVTAGRSSAPAREDASATSVGAGTGTGATIVAAAISTQTQVLASLSSCFNQLLSDSEAEVRTAAAFKVATVSHYFSPETLEAKFVPTFHQLTVDTSDHVRAAFASVIMAMAPTLGQARTITFLLPLMFQLLRDTNSEVRLNVISHLDEGNNVVGIELLSQSLLPAIQELADDKQWRVRLAIIEYIPLLAHQVGAAFFNDKLSDVSMRWLSDPVFSIREAATFNLQRLVVEFGIEWGAAEIVPKIVAMHTSPNYLVRMTALNAVKVLAACLPSLLVISTLLPLVLALSMDPVPNIRFNVAKALECLPTVVDTPRDSRIGECLHLLTQDSDTDVKYFAHKALKTLGMEEEHK